MKNHPVIDRLVGAFARFFLAGLLGLVVSFVILDVGLPAAGVNATFDALWVAGFLVAPTLWGVLGIFYFDKALEWGWGLFEEFFGGRRQ